MKDSRSHLVPVLQALLVTFLWSTSWVLIKIGLADLPALTFAGLRYSLAFILLLPLAVGSGQLTSLRKASTSLWTGIVALGLLLYAVTQGAQFVGLSCLPSTTVSLLLSFTSVIVALLGIVLLREQPSPLQWLGVILFSIGAVAYFSPFSLPTDQALGLGVVGIGVLANAGSSILGRHLNRRGDLHPLAITTPSMGIGAGFLLLGATFMEGMPSLTPMDLLLVTWLAIVNTAFAFTLWNHALRTLSAIESSVINNTMLVQIAILAWLCLGEELTPRQVLGILAAGIGALAVQLRRK